MDKFQAEKIVNEYGASIARGTEGCVVRRKAWLKNTKVMIKQAFYVYIDTIILNYGGLPRDIGEKLVMTYTMLSGFIDDEEADELIQTEKALKGTRTGISLSKKNMNKYFSYAKLSLMDGSLFDEINEYMGNVN